MVKALKKNFRLKKNLNYISSNCFRNLIGIINNNNNDKRTLIKIYLKKFNM